MDRAPIASVARPMLAAHVAATTSELIRRRFPQANMAPETAPRLPVEADTGAPPAVTRLEQVVPAATLRLVRRWARRLRRCLRAARRGDYSLAARMRPDDLWLAHDAHSVPRTAGWDWDLRPLLEGRAAVPLPASTSGWDLTPLLQGEPAVRREGGVRPDTGLCEEQVVRGAEGFADLAIVSEMLSGVEDDSRCRRGTLLCAPHAGALRHFDVALEKLAKNVTRGWGSESLALPCWPLRTSPYSIVDESLRAGEPKFRLTTDLSWPPAGHVRDGEGDVDSVNAAMDRSAWPANRLLRVREFAEAMAIMTGAQRERRVRAWSLDCEAFYRVVGRQRRELWRNGVWLEDGVQLDRRCCFGDAAAAVKCARISNFVVHCVRREIEGLEDRYPTRDPIWAGWQRERRGQVRARGGSDEEAQRESRLHWVGMYIDDEAAGGADDLVFDANGRPLTSASGGQMRRQQLYFEAARAVLERLGWSSAPSKEQPPRLRLDVLGVIVDLGAGRLLLSDDKRRRYAAQAQLVAEQRVCEESTFRELVGRLQFAAQCYPVGRQSTHSLWRALRATYRLRDGRVTVGRAVVRDLMWWADQLQAEGHEGVPLAASDDQPAPGAGAGAIYADASGEGGFCAWTLEGDRVVAVGGEWTEAERSLLICDLELLASTFGAVALRPWTGDIFCSFTDNTVAQVAMRSLRSRSPAMQAILRRRVRWMHEEGILEESRRVTSKANVWADVGSRPELGGMAELERLVAEAGLEFERVGVPAAWRDTSGLLDDDPSWERD